MNRSVQWCRLGIFALVMLASAFSTEAKPSELQLRNRQLVAQFGPSGLVAITDQSSGRVVRFSRDDFSLKLSGQQIDSAGSVPTVREENNQVAYYYRLAGFSIKVVYSLQESWKFVGKSVQILDSPSPAYTLTEVEPLRITLGEPVEGSFTPAAYLPQFGPGGDSLLQATKDRQFGTFLRLSEQAGLMLVVQNPFLEVVRTGQDTSMRYRPEMTWRQEWGPWSSDLAAIGVYRQSGRHIPAQMVYEWKLADSTGASDGADPNEIEAFTECVREFLLHPAAEPISVEVGWTLNDYQIDVATAEGRAEYKRVMDSTSDLGIQYLLYAPANHDLALRSNDADDWNWEHVLWLGLGQKIRAAQWDVEKSPLPDTVTEMLGYAKAKHLGILAYVYPSLPFAQNPAWIVHDPRKKERNAYASLASREFQDFLIHELVAFKRRTGIAGYSFDYAFLDVPGSSVYAQWRGWRRVMESLREAEPDIVIDGRQTYQAYGPWSWLAGNYPHPTGNDEQAESFTSYPDLHFDRVSADRARFVNYWYRNYQFAPHEVIPGYMTHQTPRNRNVAASGSSAGKEVAETVYTPFRRRDWDYLGYQYSVLSSIATGSWNNVVDMIPGRDLAEFEHFSADDKQWIRDWLRWTVEHKELLRHTKTILGQPAIGQIDGTAAIDGDHGFVFLFNPNYKALRAEVRWDASAGLTSPGGFVLRELYPEKGKLLGKPGEGVWKFGDVTSFGVEGTSAEVFELVPAAQLEQNPIVFGLDSIDSRKPLCVSLDDKDVLKIDHAAGQVGSTQEVAILLPADRRLKALQINGKSLAFTQHDRYVSAPVTFAGAAFTHSQEVPLRALTDGSLTGTFTVPDRIQRQLAARHARWPIPWTAEDYATTWLVPERLLLFVQLAEPSDAMRITAEADGSPLSLTRAYSSVREDSQCFVGWYADISTMHVDQPHTIHLTLPKLDPGRFQGLFFDNVEDEFTEQLAP